LVKIETSAAKAGEAAASIRSMTGYADRAGGAGGLQWTWEARSVNGRGLDLRLRLPEGAEALDPAVRQAAAGVLARGNVTVSLRLQRSETASAPRLNAATLAATLAAARAVEEAAQAEGVALAPPSAAAIMALRGVLEVEADPGVARPEVQAALAADVPPLLAALAAARRAEGAALARVLLERLEALGGLLEAARAAAEARATRTGELLRERVEAILGAGAPVDEARLSQELAMLAVKTDVTEELDRLAAHVAAARGLVAGGGAVGRKLDFLMQEFNRESNTLCAKAQSAELTGVGLEMKVLIDQMREQVQNVE
jgi:uncharacterized protein (TIGR00255 family)